MTDRVDLLFEDIVAGPTALAALLDAYGQVDGPLASVVDRPASVAFTGLGSSRYAALTAATTLRAAGLPAWTEYASTSAPTAPADDLVLVAVSASGGTPEVVPAARRHRGRRRVIAVTNRTDSPLAVTADHVLPLFAGDEHSGIATRTFRATGVVLGLLAARWLDGSHAVEDLRPAVDSLRDLIDGRDGWLAEAADRLDGAATIDVIGDAADAALVEQAALMLREAPRLPAQAHETGDWLHTAVYLVFPGHRAVLFDGGSSDDKVVRVIAGRGGESIVVGQAVDGAAMTIPIPATPGPIERAIVVSAVAELLAAELWRRTGGSVDA